MPFSVPWLMASSFEARKWCGGVMALTWPELGATMQGVSTDLNAILLAPRFESNPNLL
jgi:hypothetical protein